MEQDYSHLVGKEVQIITRDGVICPGVVSDIEPGIGVTIHHKDDPTIRLWCLTHPNILAKKFNVERSAVQGSDTDFEDLFRHYVEGIESGVMTEMWLERHDSIMRRFSHDYDATGDLGKMCAFI